MTGRTYGVLFLGVANSARSILAEAILNDIGAGRFRACSAGSYPLGSVHPIALGLLEHLKLPTEDLRSKGWDEYALPGAPPLDFIITVCGRVAEHVCPVWPGQPVTAHWDIADPATVEGSEIERWQAFRRAFRELEHRIRLLLALPLDSLEHLQLHAALTDVGARGAPAEARG